MDLIFFRTPPSWDPIREQVSSVVADDAVDIPDVLRRLAALKTILRMLPGGARGPAASFNDLYLRITTQVHEYVEHGVFKSPEFLSRLDVEFARRYLHAIRMMAAGDDGSVPRSWQVVFNAGREVSPIAAAAAGVNAHVNYDLAFALIATLRDRSHFPDRPEARSAAALAESPEYNDYLLVNQIFHHEMPGLIKHFSYNDVYLDWLYNVQGRSPNRYVAEDDLVIVTRGIAWDVCERNLWPDRHDPTRLAETDHQIDELVSVLGKLIISPLGRIAFGTRLPWVQRATTSRLIRRTGVAAPTRRPADDTANGHA